MTETQRKPELDPQGSLVDADEALAIGPAWGRAGESSRPVDLQELVGQAS